MSGRILGSVIVGVALFAGIALYYLQVYRYYDRVSDEPGASVELTSVVTGLAEPILYEEFQAIDAESSPIRYRACFTTPLSQALLSETFELIDKAEPRVAPGWFGCFDAQAIGAGLTDGQALAFMGTRNIEWGIDRVVAIFPDGRGYVWHQINHCGDEVFDGKPAPPDCPAQPDRLPDVTQTESQN